MPATLYWPSTLPRVQGYAPILRGLGPQLWYPFDDDTCIDKTGNGNDGTVTDATYAAGKTGRGMSFNGSSALVQLPILHYTAYSISFWYAGTDAGSTETAASSRKSFFAAHRPSNQNNIAVSLDGSGLVCFRWANAAGTSVVIQSATAVNTGAYFHIRATHTGAAAYLRINNVLEASNTSTSLIADAPVSCKLMRYSASYGNYIAGVLDEVNIYNREVVEEDRNAWYNNLTLYSALPEYTIPDGYQESPIDAAIRSSMDTGPMKTRRRFTTDVRRVSARYHLSATQKQELDHFYRITALAGTLRFWWPHPQFGEVEAAFLGPPQFVPWEHEAIASVQLEVYA